MDTMLGGLDFTIAYLDDILIKSQDKDEHKMPVNQVFKRIQDYGFIIKESTTINKLLTRTRYAMKYCCIEIEWSP